MNKDTIDHMEAEFLHALITLLTADSLDNTFQLAMNAFVAHTRPQRGVILLWDSELDRYIIGDTYPASSDRREAAAFRRYALSSALAAYHEDKLLPRCVDDGVFYQPLNAGDDYHIGAYLCEGVFRVPPADDDSYRLLIQCVMRALDNSSRLQLADRIQADLEAEHARLEELLQAVNQQQHTIDTLLSLERQFSASLEAKVKERTAALEAAQQRLIQSEKLAVIGQLASSLAHELNNPMQAIQSGLGLVLDDLADGDTQHARGDLRVIQEELTRMQGIFAQMLDFQRPVAYRSAPMDLNAICAGVQMLMRKRLQDSHVQLEMNLSDYLPQTCGDSNQIKQILINLVLNAAEAMGLDGGTVTLRTVADADHVSVVVEDDGPGIQAEHIHRVFEPLFTTKTRGLGVGLAISQEIAQRHGGLLAVTSHPGDGTIFTLNLPIQEDCDGENSRS